jgi:hypothetical protein
VQGTENPVIKDKYLAYWLCGINTNSQLCAKAINMHESDTGLKYLQQSRGRIGMQEFAEIYQASVLKLITPGDLQVSLPARNSEIWRGGL